MRIVQLANFVTPTSGGIRTALARLGAGYRQAGHERALVVPGRDDGVDDTADGRVIRIASPRLPRSGGYRVIVDTDRVRRVLAGLRPERLEVHDRATLRVVGDWAMRHDVPATAVVHERLDHLARMALPWVVRPELLARRDNARVAARFQTVVTPSAWAAEEFRRAGVRHVRVVGWGVELDRFTPDRRSAVLRRRLLRGEEVLVVTACRLSPEKRPGSAVDALVELRRRGVAARLVVAGTGSLDRRLRRQATGLPVTFLGHVRGRDHVADLLAAADVVICPGPVETFGLAALEALACGTPVISARSGAVGELLDPACGEAVHPPAMAGAVERMLATGAAARQAARSAAERHPWQAAVDRMLELHGLRGPATPAVSSGSRMPGVWGHGG